MSTTDPSLSFEEVMQHELDKLQNVIVRDRELLKKEVEELRMKKMESDEAAQLYKAKLHDLEQRLLKNPISISAATSSPIIGSSNKGAPYLLNHGCDLKIISTIKKRLEKENFERLQQSCFGHLLKIDELIEFQGQVVLQLVMHMDTGASNKERLVFKIKDREVEFGPRDFSLITGLRLGTMEAPTSSPIHRDVFKGRPKITLKHIKEAFICHKGKGELTLKLGLLYFLYGTVLAGHPHNQIHQLRYLHLVDDLHKFNAFPWGQAAYEFLASFMLSARERMDGLEVVSNKKATLYMHGFTFALQVWAYEVMPSLAQYCAIRASSLENVTPRILRWAALKRFIRFESIKKFFSVADREPMAVHGIEASPWELEKLASYTILEAKKKKDQMCDATATALPSANAPTPQNKAHVLLRGCSSYASGDLIIISDSDDDDDDDDEIQKTACAMQTKKRKRSDREREAAAAAANDCSATEHPSRTTRNESAQVGDEEAAVKEEEAEQPASYATTPTRRSCTSAPNPISISINNKHANLEQATPLSQLANHNPARHMRQLLPKENSESETCEGEYEKEKARYERILTRAKRLKLWISYANFEASFGVKQEESSDFFSDKRKCIERVRAVFERGHSYFRSRAPEMKEERAKLLEEWLNMERSFGALGDVALVHAKQPRKIKKRIHIQTDDDEDRKLNVTFQSAAAGMKSILTTFSQKKNNRTHNLKFWKRNTIQEEEAQDCVMHN